MTVAGTVSYLPDRLGRCSTPFGCATCSETKGRSIRTPIRGIELPFATVPIFSASYQKVGVRIMTTTHTARRQRTSHRTTAHGRTLSTKPNATVVAATPANDEKPAPVRVVKPMRSPDSDDHLAAYFRQLAEHELLTPEDERELSQ